MKYLCQVWLDERVMHALSDAEKRDLDRQSMAYDRELAERGHLLLASPLAAPETALTIRVREGKLSTTDGPFAESREHLGAFPRKGRRQSELLRRGCLIHRLGEHHIRWTQHAGGGGHGHAVYRHRHYRRDRDAA